MADVSALKNRIRAVIKANNNQEITGPVLQAALLDIVDELNGRNIDGYTFVGVAIPTTVPPSDLTEYSRICYFASQNGIYTNLGNTEVSNEIAIIKYNGLSWNKESCIGIDDEPTVNSENLVKSGGVAEFYGKCVENPEFVYVKTDAEGKIIWAIKKDGDIHFGAGVPQQVIDYVEKKIAEVSPEGYAEVIVFLDGLEQGDKTLRQLLNAKVDKVTGKQLSSNDYTNDEKEIVNLKSITNGNKYVHVTLDSEDKLLSYVDSTGKHWFNDLHSQTIDKNTEDIAQLDNRTYCGGTLHFERGAITQNGSIATYWATQNFRTPKYISASKNIELSFAAEKVNGVQIFEYAKDFSFVKSTIITASSDIALHQDTFYVKILVATNDINYPNVDIMTFADPNNIEVYNERLDGDEHSFIYEVAPNYGRDIIVSDANVRQYDNNVYYNKGLLMLPPNYTQSGEPVRMVIFCHGSADYLSRNSTTFSSYYENYIHWLRDNGYAIMDCFSHSSRYDSINTPYGWACVDEINCMVNAYNWVVTNYNIRKDGVHLGCKSHGGLAALSLCFNRGIPVLSCGLLAPATSQIMNPGSHIFGYADNPSSRNLFLQDMQFEDVEGVDSSCLLTDTQVTVSGQSRYLVTTDRKTYVLGNVDKIIGWNPIICGMEKEDAVNAIKDIMNENYDSDYLKSSRKCDVPIKVWAAADDLSVGLYPYVCALVEGINHGGGVGVLRRMPDGTGGHHSVDTDTNALTVATITTELGVAYTDIPLAWVEMWQWFKQHD